MKMIASLYPSKLNVLLKYRKRLNSWVAARKNSAPNDGACPALKLFIKWILPILAFISFTYAQASSINPLTPNDFAYGIPLTIQPGSTFYKLVLPLEAYQNMTQANGNDVRVFDSAGKLMPSTLRNIVSQKQSTQQINLPVFPIYGKKSADINNIPLRIQRTQKGTIVDFGSDNTPQNQRHIIAYLLDTSHLKKPLYKLTLNINPAVKDFIQRVNVSYSDNLNQFTPLVSNVAIANLYQNNQRIEQRDIIVNDTEANYWLFTWEDNNEPLELKSITAEPSSTLIPRPRLMVQLNPLSNSLAQEEYLFNLQGYMPTDGARILFSDQNQVAQVKLFSRANTNDKWQYQTQGLAYDLKTNSSNELRFSATFDRYWRLVIENNQGKNTPAPLLELHWTPQELVFVANGQPPYMLVFGNGAIQTANFDVNELMNQMKRSTGADPIIKPASVGNLQTLGGQDRLKSAIAWQKWLLWSVLGVGAGLLIWMALRLFKQLGREKI